MGNKTSKGASQGASQNASQNAAQYALQGSPKMPRRDAATGAYKDGPPPAPTHKYATKSQLRLSIKKYEDLIASGTPRLPDNQYKEGFAPFNPDTDFNLLTAENTDPDIINSNSPLSMDDAKNTLYTKRLVDRFNIIYPNIDHEWGGGARKRRRKTKQPKKLIKRRKTRKNTKK